MAIDVNGTTLQYNNGSLEAYSGATKLFEFDDIGALMKSSVNASFLVGNSTAGWITLTAGTWTEYLLWDTIYRVTPTNASFASNGRFYAPVRGLYALTLNAYCYSPSGGYIHPGIWVNGNSTRGAAGNNHSHRIRGHGITASYTYDINFTELKFLEQGDYASFFYYVGTSGGIYGQYSSFGGYLVG